MTVSVTATAQAMSAGQFNKVTFKTGMLWYPGYYENGKSEALPDEDYLSDADSEKLATLLGGKVVKAPPYRIWVGFNPSNPVNGSIPDACLCNFIQFLDGSVVSAADVAAQASISFCVGNLNREQILEFELSFMVPGGEVSQQAQDGLNRDRDAQIQYSTVYIAAPVIYTPPAAAVAAPSAIKP
ncbi:MAG: hypothetical protein WDO73_03105 [Ignavibacteriota bacterium]